MCIIDAALALVALHEYLVLRSFLGQLTVLANLSNV